MFLLVRAEERFTLPKEWATLSLTFLTVIANISKH
jgi:hypothetical protein